MGHRPVFEKLRDQLLCLFHFALHAIAEVHRVEHVAAQLFECFEHFGRHDDRFVVAVERLRDDVAHHAVDALAAGFAEGLANRFGDVVGGDDAGANTVVDVVIDIRDDVGDADDVAF